MIPAPLAAVTPSAAREKLYETLTAVSKGAYLIQGPSLVGKTWLLEELRKYLQQYEPRKPLVHHFVCSSSHAGYEPVLDAIETLSKRANWSNQKKISSLGKKYGGGIFTFAGGVFRRFFPDAIPKETLEQIRANLDAFTKQPPEKGVASEFPRSECSKIVNLLNEVITKSGRSLVILVDRIEELPTPGIKLLQMLVDIVPDGVITIAAANSESSAYSSRSDIRELVSSFRRTGGTVYSLCGYSVQEILMMRKFNGFATSQTTAEIAHRYSQGGVYGLLKGWLNSADENNEILKPAADQMVAYYSIQYGKLDDQAKNLVKALGAVYPKGVNLNVAAICLGCNLGEIEGKVREVLGAFAVLSGVDLVLANAHVLHFLRSDVGPAFVQAAYVDLVSKLELSKSSATQVGGIGQNLALAIPLSVQAMEAATLLIEVREDLARGAHSTAMTRLQAWRAWPGRAHTVEEAADLLLLEADALGQVGAYDEAIERLEQVPVGSSREVDVDISYAEKTWRAGRQLQALHRLGVARQKAREIGRADAWLKAAMRTIAIKNEMREGLPSVRLAEKLIDYCTNVPSISSRDKCHVYRTVARTFALIPSKHQEGEQYATQALKLARSSLKSSRDEGNAQYAYADVLRHQGQQADAIAEYEKARKIAANAGNYDLELYALLGIAASAIKFNDTLKLLAVLEDLSVVCNDSQSPEAKIIDLFKLTLKRLQGEHVPFVDPACSVSGRPWTTELLKILSNPNNTPEIIRNAVIVL